MTKTDYSLSPLLLWDVNLLRASGTFFVVTVGGSGVSCGRTSVGAVVVAVGVSGNVEGGGVCTARGVGSTGGMRVDGRMVSGCTFVLVVLSSIGRGERGEGVPKYFRSLRILRGSGSLLRGVNFLKNFRLRNVERREPSIITVY